MQGRRESDGNISPIFQRVGLNFFPVCFLGLALAKKQINTTG
jgi:hypothetical protein